MGVVSVDGAIPEPTPAFACGFAEGSVLSALRYLRAIPAPKDQLAAMRLQWAIDDLVAAIDALRVPFEVAS